jgi:hypothetical protein
VKGKARKAREAAVASAYEPLVGLKQLGTVGGGEGSVWVGAQDSPALGGFAPSPADRQRNGQPRHHWYVYLSRWRAAGQLGKQLLELAVSWESAGNRWPPAWGPCASRWSCQMPQTPQRHTTRTGVRRATASTRAASASCQRHAGS